MPDTSNEAEIGNIKECIANNDEKKKVATDDDNHGYESPAQMVAFGPVEPRYSCIICSRSEGRDLVIVGHSEDHRVQSLQSKGRRVGCIQDVDEDLG